MTKLLLIPALAFAILLTGCGNQTVNNSTAKEAKDDTTSELVAKKDPEKKVADKNVEEKNSKVEKEAKDGEEKEIAKTTFSDNIKVTSFKANDTLVSPVLIEGEADIESGVLLVELRKSDHSLTSEIVEAPVRDGKFKISKFWFEFKNTDEGFVAVYDKGSKENLVEIPVKFQTVK